MNTAQLTIEGNVAVNPTLRFTPSGVPVAELVVLVNNRRKVAGEWKDDEPNRFRITDSTPSRPKEHPRTPLGRRPRPAAPTDEVPDAVSDEVSDAVGA